MHIAKKCVQVFMFSLLISVLSIPATNAAGTKNNKNTDTPIYVDFKHIVVPIIQKNGRTGMIALNLMAEVKDAEAQSVVNSHMPRLRDAFIRSLYGTMEDKQFISQNGNLDVDRIKTRLMHTVNLVMKDKNDHIKDILFQNITQQTY